MVVESSVYCASLSGEVVVWFEVDGFSNDKAICGSELLGGSLVRETKEDAFLSGNQSSLKALGSGSTLIELGSEVTSRC